MATKGFTKISNSVLFDLNLSANAFMIYSTLVNLSTRKNFIIKRDYVKHLVAMGEKSFAKAWKQLKDLGLLLMKRTREGKKWNYEFSLSEKTSIKNKNKKDGKKKNDAPIDSNGEKPLDGQVHVDELLDSATPELQANDFSIDPKEIELVSNETGLEENQAKELLKIANTSRILEVYEYSKDRANELFSYMFSAIKNNWTIRKNYAPAPSIYVNNENIETGRGNYTSNNSKRFKRQVTEEEIRKAEELENALLGWV